MKSISKKTSFGFFVLGLVGMLLSTTISVVSMRTMGKENQKEVNTLLAARIHDHINSSLTEPIMAARTLANTEALHDFIREEESKDNLEEDSEKMQSYLQRLKEGFNYDTAFLVSTKTSRYYSDQGFNKIVDPFNDSHDIWYSIFLAKNKEYDLDVDVDEVHGGLTVFVNNRLENNGELLGVCGVGVKMSELQELLLDYENKYNVKINLVDKNGLVQVDTDEINIENSYLTQVNIKDNDDNYIYQEYNDNECSVTKYVENLGWYLVVRSFNNTFSDDILKIIRLNIYLFLAVVMIFVAYNHANNRRAKHLLKTSYIDHLTGVQNRRAYEEVISRLSLDKLGKDLVYLNVDVNSLKIVNDTLGHTAGDEIIKACADCLNKVFKNHGNVYRIGGDEFAVIVKANEETINRLKDHLEKEVSSWRGEFVDQLTISVGYVTSGENETWDILEMIKESDRRMYKDKDDFYKRTGIDRRKV